MKKKTKTKARRRSYVANPAPKRARRRPRTLKAAARRVFRRYRSNPGFDLATVAKTGGAALGGALLLPFLRGKLPPTISRFKNPILLALGAALMGLFWRKNQYVAAAGLGAAIVGTRNMIVSKVPTLAGPNELTEDEVAALSGYGADDTDLEELNGPLLGDDSYDDESRLLNGPILDGDDEQAEYPEMGNSYAAAFAQPMI